MKKCPDCGFERPLEDFYKNRGTKDGRGHYCKDHAAIRSKQSYMTKGKRTEKPRKKLNHNKAIRAKLNANANRWRKKTLGLETCLALRIEVSKIKIKDVQVVGEGKVMITYEEVTGQ